MEPQGKKWSTMEFRWLPLIKKALLVNLISSKNEANWIGKGVKHIIEPFNGVSLDELLKITTCKYA